MLLRYFVLIFGKNKNKMEYKISTKVVKFCNGYMNTATMEEYIDEFINQDKALLIQVMIFDAGTKEWKKFNSKNSLLICNRGNFIISPEHDNSDFLRLRDIKVSNGTEIEFQSIEINDEFLDTLRANLLKECDAHTTEIVINYYKQFIPEPMQVLRNPVTDEIIYQGRPEKNKKQDKHISNNDSISNKNSLNIVKRKLIESSSLLYEGEPDIYEAYSDDGSHWAILEYYREDPETGEKFVFDRAIMPYEHYSFEEYMNRQDPVDHAMESYYAMIDGDEDEYPDYYPGAFDDYFM